MKVKEIKTKLYQLYLNMFRIYLTDIINDHKTQGKQKVHLGNTVIDYKAEGEWKFQ